MYYMPSRCVQLICSLILVCSTLDTHVNAMVWQHSTAQCCHLCMCLSGMQSFQAPQVSFRQPCDRLQPKEPHTQAHVSLCAACLFTQDGRPEGHVFGWCWFQDSRGWDLYV